MVYPRVYSRIFKKVASNQQPISPLSAITIGSMENWKITPLSGFKNTRVLNLFKWVLHRSNQKTTPNNLLMGRYIKVRKYQGKWRMVLLPSNGEKYMKHPLVATTMNSNQCQFVLSKTLWIPPKASYLPSNNQRYIFFCDRISADPKQCIPLLLQINQSHKYTDEFQ